MTEARHFNLAQKTFNRHLKPRLSQDIIDFHLTDTGFKKKSFILQTLFIYLSAVKLLYYAKPPLKKKCRFAILARA